MESSTPKEDKNNDRLTNRDKEIQQLRDEFNMQRAKMKDLYLSKEEEVRVLSVEKQQMMEEVSQLRRQVQTLEEIRLRHSTEIDSLQMLVHETVEASSSASNSEMRRLQAKCLELEQQLNLAARQNAPSPDISLAPSALVQAVTKRIARHLNQDPNCQESLEDSMKKAQEDANVLRSLVVPLEEEIASLKEKLRETDAQLQQANDGKMRSSKTNESLKDGEAVCDMCQNYEAQLVSEQAKTREYMDKVTKLEVSLKRSVEELEQEAQLRRDILTEWRAAREDAMAQSQALTERVNRANGELQASTRTMREAHARILDDVTRLTVDRETLQERLDSLQTENERLMGKYSQCSAELQVANIDLPNNIADLQEHCLRLREELIIALIGRERAQQSEQTLGLLQRHAEELERLNEDLTLANRQLRCELDDFAEERNQIRSMGDQLRMAHTQLQEGADKKKQLENQISELRSRVSSLQQDLDNSEMVQQDFVKLSQSLQVQLERIRSSDAEVRWQHDEDVEECCSCKGVFSSGRKKQHCRHCGRIFCASCLSHVVPSGPRLRPSPVCDVCHTLLVTNTAPYFSTEVPHTPD